MESWVSTLQAVHIPAWHFIFTLDPISPLQNGSLQLNFLLASLCNLSALCGVHALPGVLVFAGVSLLLLPSGWRQLGGFPFAKQGVSITTAPQDLSANKNTRRIFLLHLVPPAISQKLLALHMPSLLLSGLKLVCMLQIESGSTAAPCAHLHRGSAGADACPWGHQAR